MTFLYFQSFFNINSSRTTSFLYINVKQTRVLFVFPFTGVKISPLKTTNIFDENLHNQINIESLSCEENMCTYKFV